MKIVKLSAISYQLSVISLIAVCFLPFSCGKKAPPTLKSYEKPDPPTRLKAIHREDRVILSWSYGKKENLKGFYVLKADDGSFQQIAFVDKDKDSYADTSIKTDISYKYKIVAQSLKNILSNDSNIISIKPGRVPPIPKNISFRVGNEALLISWDKPAEEILYNIYKSYEKSKYDLNPLNSEPLKTTSFTDPLEFNKPVYYTVRGVVVGNEFKDEGTASDEIEVNPVNFMPSSPHGLEAILTEDKIVLVWKENSEAWITKYRVYRKITGKDGFKLIGESVTPVFTIREKTGARHFYKVTAVGVGPSRESELSETVEVEF